MNSSIITRNVFQSTLLAAAAALLAAGCGSGAGGSSPTLGAQPKAQSKVVATSRAALEVQRAARQLDVGKNAAGAEATLQSVLKDPATSRDDHDRAEIQLARALDAEGKHEAAVETVEKLLRARVDDHPWSLERAASRELRKLLTGSAKPHDPSTITANIPPFARLLAKYYLASADRTPSPSVEIKMLSFGGDDAVSGRLGTFDIPEAIRAVRAAKCPLCDQVHTGMDRDSSDWTAIPAYADRLASSLDVFYFDLGADRIPTRYAKYLPLPVDQIVQRLNQGEGLIAAKKRQGAPPVILLGAPRRAQLPDVEKKLASLDQLPTTPLSVEVPARLQRGEIQAVVRSAREAFRSCFNALLARTPAAHGTVTLSFTINADGSVSDSSANVTSGTLDHPEFERCMANATEALTFPKVDHGKNTVRYPIVFVNER